MGFGAEMKDFISGFQTGADIVSNIKDRRDRRDKNRQPTDEELEAMPDVEEGDTAIPEYVPPSDDTTTGSTSSTSSSGDTRYRDAIASIESAGTKDPYRAIGDVVNRSGDRALGRYQIMASNVGPWSKQVLGRELSTEEFLANNDYQDQIFDTIFGGYVDKYGERGAAQAWFSGPGNVGKESAADLHGTTNKRYGDRFLAALGKAPSAGAPQVKEAKRKAEPVVPEDEGVDFASLSGIGGGGSGGGTERKSDRERKPLPEAVLPELTDWTEWDKRNSQTTLARKGGVIPGYADGGTVDPYNSSRVFTQVNEEGGGGTTGSTGSTSGTAAAVGGTSSWKPRKVGEPTSTAATTSSVKDATTGLTPSQQAWRDSLAKLEASRAAAAVPVAEDTNPYNLTRLQEYDALMQYMYDRAQPSTRTLSGGNDAGDENTVTSVNKVAQDRYNELRKGKEAYLAGTDPSWAEGWLTKYRADPGETWGALYARGGTVQGYASGGMVRGVVTVDPDYWEAAIKRESKGGGDEQEIRDRAAKRINRAQRGVESSAIRVGKRGQQAVDKGRERTERTASRTPGTAPVPTGRPARLPDVAAAPAPRPGTQVAALSRNPYDTQRGEPVVVAEASAPTVDTRPGRVSDEYVRPSVRDTPVNPPGVVAGGAGRVSDEYVIPEDTSLVARMRENLREPPVDFSAVPTPYEVGSAIREGVGSATRGGAGPQVPVTAGDPWWRGSGAAIPVEEDRATRVRPIARPPMVVGAPGLKRGDPGEVVLSDPPRNPIVTPDDRATREGRMPTTGGGGWMGRAAPTIRPATPEEEAMAPPANQMVVRPPVQMGGRVDLSGPAAPFRGGFIQMNDGRVMMWQQDGTLVPAMPPVDPSAMFASGGVIPEEDEPLGGRRPEQYAPPASNPPPRVQTGPGQNTAREWPVDEQPQYENVKPTKKLRDHVAQALDGGAKFLTRHFGLSDSGGVPDPDQGRSNEDAAMRMARGEGAATPEEISGIDDKVDPGRRLDEGDRHMTRLAKMTQWYLQQGRKEDAEASAASLMMYGSKRFSQLGQLAATGYRKYQQTGDPNDLRKTTQYLEQAYKLIPDGSKLDVSLNPETKTLQVTRLLPDGQEVTHDLTPAQLGGVVRQATNTSTYWQQVFRLADPQGARDIASERRQEKRDIRTEARQNRLADRREQVDYDREMRRNENLRAYEERKAARTEEGLDRRERERLAAEDRRHERTLASEERRAEAEQRRYERNNPQVDWGVINPLRAEVKAAENALAEDESPEAEARYNAAASRMFDALTGMSKEPAKVMTELGVDAENYTYVSGGGGGAPYKGTTPPPGIPDAKLAPDGNWYRPDATAPKGWAIVEAP